MIRKLLSDKVFRQIVFDGIIEYDRSLDNVKRTDFCRSLISARDKILRLLGSDTQLDIELEGRKHLAFLSATNTTIAKWEVKAIISGDL